MKNKSLAFTIFLALLVAGCGKSNSKTENQPTNDKTTCNINYAQGFKIEHYTDYTKVIVRNPWDTARIMETYILIDRNKKTPKNLPQGNIVKVPVQRVATCSSIFAGEYKQLGDINKIRAISEPEYVDILGN